jgi:hypothetical protein
VAARQTEDGGARPGSGPRGDRRPGVT